MWFRASGLRAAAQADVMSHVGVRARVHALRGEFAVASADRIAVAAQAQLAELVYELLDAHADTVRLVDEPVVGDVGWDAHLVYLRDLQRVGREVLARVA